MSYREEDERVLLTGFIEWLAERLTIADGTRAIVSGEAELVTLYLKARAVERAWGKAEGGE